MKYIFLIGVVGLFFFMEFMSPFSTYESLSIALCIYSLLSFVDDLGKKFLVLDIILLSAIFICLIMPIAGYHYFNINNRLASLWVRYMRVSSNEYYSFMFPATIALYIGLKSRIFFRKSLQTDNAYYIKHAKLYLSDKPKHGVYLICVGIVSTILKPVVPGVLQHFFFLLSYLLFVGLFYCIYSDFKYKKTVLYAAFAFLIARSLVQGMFGELIFIAIMSVMLTLVGTNFSFFRKMVVISSGVMVVFFIQLIKPDFRKETWRKGNKNEITTFYRIASEKMNNPASLVKNELVWFNMYSRFNEGLIISMVLKSVPRNIEYANGETIFLSLAGSIIPRIVWPDKPQAGGVYNFKRFLGVNLKGYSVGISPYGEAWGNFGKNGGIVFMFFFGLMYNFLFSLLLKYSIRVPSVILWIPFLFFYAVQIESDIFTMVNSLTQALIFMVIIYQLFYRVFRIRL
jgi:hypothetical protein